MSASLVTVNVWHDAQEHPPREGVRVLTDIGMAKWWSRNLLHPQSGWYYPIEGEYMDPQPTVWCDPKPPGKDALTLADLRRVHDLCWEATLLTDNERDSLHNLLAAIESVSGPS